MTSCARRVAVFACAYLSFVAFGRAQDLGASALKENLDLPFSAGGEGLPEEAASEEILFYGRRYAGNGFFFVLDRSGTMRDNGELVRAARELVQSISQLSEKSEFAITAFDSGFTKFPSHGRPVRATATMKAVATGWVRRLLGGGGTCVRRALEQSLSFATLSRARRKVIIYLGDGGGTCNGTDEAEYLQQTVETVLSRNDCGAVIHTIGVCMAGRALQERFLRDLARTNRGTYRSID